MVLVPTTRGGVGWGGGGEEHTIGRWWAESKDTAEIPTANPAPSVPRAEAETLARGSRPPGPCVKPLTQAPPLSRDN